MANQPEANLCRRRLSRDELIGNLSTNPSYFHAFVRILPGLGIHVGATKGPRSAYLSDPEGDPARSDFDSDRYMASFGLVVYQKLFSENEQICGPEFRARGVTGHLKNGDTSGRYIILAYSDRRERTGEFEAYILLLPAEADDVFNGIAGDTSNLIPPFQEIFPEGDRRGEILAIDQEFNDGRLVPYYTFDFREYMRNQRANEAMYAELERRRSEETRKTLERQRRLEARYTGFLGQVRKLIDMFSGPLF